METEPIYLDQLLDTAELTAMLNNFYEISKLPVFIYDHTGKQIITSMWTDICLKFHMAHPTTSQNCEEVKRRLKKIHGCRNEKGYHLIHCGNGLCDAASPILVDGILLGSFHFGQFVMEEPDMEFFKKQAIHYGFPETDYLEAVGQIPVITETELETRIQYLTRFVTYLCKSALQDRQRRKTEAELIESEEKFRLISEQSMLGISIVQDGVTVYVNKVITEITGYTPAEIMGMSLEEMFEAIHPEDREFAREQYHKKQSGQADYIVDYSYRSITKSGDIKWLRIFSKPILYNGRVALLKSTVDISDHMAAITALRQSEEKYRNVVDNAIEAICIIQDDRFVYFNPEAVRLYEYSVAELENIDLMRLIHPEDQQTVLARRHAREQGEYSPTQYTHRIVTRTGTIKWIDLKAVLITWQDKPATLTFLTDITAKKRAQELMIQTEKMISIGNLAAGTAHELNNPLGGILQGIQNISRRLSPDLKANLGPARKAGIDLVKLQSYLDWRGINKSIDSIRDLGRKAADIITSMLQFSRKSESRISMENLVELVDDAITLAAKNYDLKRKYDFNAVKIIRDIDPGLPLVPCNRTEIEQVILNLLNNAAWAMARDSRNRTAQITIRMKKAEKNIRLEIADNGPGMDAEKRKRIFEPFYTTKPEGEGTGLGLSVAYMIVTNNHQGTLEIQSSPGKGATFVIHLPLVSKALEKQGKDVSL